MNGYPRAKNDRRPALTPSSFFPGLESKPIKKSGSEIVAGFKDRFRP